MVNHDVVRKVIAFETGVLHISSFILLTVGYFTPLWIYYDPSMYYSSDQPWLWFGISCYSVGIVSRICSSYYNIPTGSPDYVLNNAFIMMTTAIGTVYVITAMIVGALIFGLHNYNTYMSFLSVFLGVLYPGAAIVTLVASIYVMASFPAWYGYSAILCLTAGILMIVAYASLILYEYVYLKTRRKEHVASKKNTEMSGKAPRTHLLNAEAYATMADIVITPPSGALNAVRDQQNVTFLGSRETSKPMANKPTRRK